MEKMEIPLLLSLTHQLKRMVSTFFLLFALSIFLNLITYIAYADTIFQQNCAGCHTIGGGELVGPDLNNITKKRDHDWLIKFINSPQEMFSKGDKEALALKDKYGGIMPAFPKISAKQIKGILTYIESQSQSQAKGEAKGPTDTKGVSLTEKNIQIGRQLFLGTKALKNKGTACNACHATSTVRGGRLGPDLTQAVRRFGEAKKLIGWITALPSPLMKPIYAEHPLEEDEILSLVTFLASENDSKIQSNFPIEFLSLGIVGALLILALSGMIWRKRLRAVRDPMVKGSNRGDR